MRISGIVEESIVDGEGWRGAIFFQGCLHHCVGCQNEHTWNINGGKEISLNELEEAVDSIVESNPLIDGITLTGGDPFFQADEIIALCDYIKNTKHLNLWVYTGFTFERFLEYKNDNTSNNKYSIKVTESMIKLLDYIDVLVDGPFILEKRTLDGYFAGSSNQRVIDVKKTMQSGKITLYNG